MKRLVIGDIHGCFTELQELLDRAVLSAGDEIISAGDFVDRGPDSPRVLAFFREQPNTRAIQGNHERKHVRSARGEVKAALSQRIARQQLGDAYSHALTFLESLPLYLELPEANIVHGYWEPGLPATAQRETVLAGTIGGEKYLHQNYARPWHELYDRDKPIIVGHKDYMRNGQPFIHRDRVFGIDTSCCHGEALTGIVLPDFRFLSVPSHADHWRDLRRAFKPLKPAQPPVLWDEEDDALLGRIQDHVLQEHAHYLTQLRQKVAFDELSAHEQGKVYAEFIGVRPLAFLLHLARRGELNPEKLRRVLQTPERASKIAVEFGWLQTDAVESDLSASSGVDS